jgi:hypothetical protein
MAANTSLRITELDFFAIRENLKTYLKSQDKFSDYNFEGSGLSILLDVLAYNTYYNSYYLNVIANESFLETAQDRKNIVAYAKTLNYIPSSAHGATSVIDVSVTPSTAEDQNSNFIVLDRYARLMGADVNGRNYPFATLNANSAYKVNGTFNFANVVIKQGEVMTHQYVYDPSNLIGHFQIPSANVDTDTLIVTVQQSSSNNQVEQYFPVSDITNLQANSKVYYLEENADSNYDIFFGDGYIGKSLDYGNIVQVTYLDTAGSVANNIQRFVFTDPIAGLYRNNVKINVTQGSYGGGDKEDIETIRFRVPYAFTAQNRCVTKSDYSTLISKDFPNIEAISVWGGEENDPPVYGKVYASVKTRGYYTLTELEKNNIKNHLTQNRSILTVIPEIVDPEYIFIQISGTVTYNPLVTTSSESDLLQSVKNTIYTYAQNELYNFESTFKLSKLQNYIETSDPAITASDIQIYLQNRKPILTGNTETYVVNYNTPIRKGDQFQKLYSYPNITVLDSSGASRQVFIEEVPNAYTGVDSVDVISPGINYTSSATVTISGDGSGATAEPVVVNGRVRSVLVTSPGINYTRATATITDAFGAEATFKVNLASDYGVLRTYYYQDNGQKVFVNEQAGTIDYLTGKVVLNSLYALAVASNPFYDKNVLTINIVPEKNVITPLRNRLLAIDTNNAQSIQIKMVPQA